jgi:hypothetical protein
MAPIDDRAVFGQEIIAEQTGDRAQRVRVVVLREVGGKIGQDNDALAEIQAVRLEVIDNGKAGCLAVGGRALAQLGGQLIRTGGAGTREHPVIQAGIKRRHG